MFFSDYLDPLVAHWEQRFFGCQPSVLFMEKLPWLAVSELFYASYFSYYIMIVGVGIALFLRSRQQFFHYVSVVSFLFYVCYLIYICRAGDRVPGVLPAGGWLCAAGGDAAPGRDGRVSRGRAGGGLLPDHEVDLSRVRGAGRGVPQQPCGGGPVHGVLLVPLPAAHPLPPPGGRAAALLFDGVLPLPLRGGCPGRAGDGGRADSHRQLALLPVHQT